MRPVKITVTGVGTSQWLKLDNKALVFNIGFGCVVTGTATYTVEHTFDDVDSADTITAFPHAVVAGQVANKDGNYAYPVTAIRLNVTAGAGSVKITAVQAGNGG